MKPTMYKLLHAHVASLSVVNDAAERALGLLTAFNTGRITKSEEQMQFVCQCVRDIRKKNSMLATSAETCTQQIIKAFEYF